MLIEEIIEKLGDNFDEIRRTPHSENPEYNFICYLIDTRRFSGRTIREALEKALKENEESKTQLA